MARAKSQNVEVTEVELAGTEGTEGEGQVATTSKRGPQLRWNIDRDRAFIGALQAGMNTYPAVVAYLKEHPSFAGSAELIDEQRLKIRALNLRRKGVNVPRFKPSGERAPGGYAVPVDELNAMLPVPAPAAPVEVVDVATDAG